MLTGKPLLIGDPSKISWTITEGQNLATLGRSGENAKSASLTVKKDITQQGNIRIEVTVKSGKKVTINFVAIPPSGMSSKHRRRSYDRSNPDFNKRGVPILNADGDMVNAGASGLLEVTLSPTNVSFTNIHVIELDKGTVPDPPPSLATSHNPNPIPVAPDEKNRIGDQVGTSRPVSFLSQHQLPQNWYWDCDFNCYESRILMRNTKQRFIYEKQSLEGNIINVVSSKFDSSVSRTTASGNKHVF